MRVRVIIPKLHPVPSSPPPHPLSTHTRPSTLHPYYFPSSQQLIPYTSLPHHTPSPPANVLAPLLRLLPPSATVFLSASGASKPGSEVIMLRARRGRTNNRLVNKWRSSEDGRGEKQQRKKRREAEGWIDAGI